MNQKTNEVSGNDLKDQLQELTLDSMTQPRTGLHFLPDLPEIIMNMDPDTTRYIEYVWSHRMLKGKNTDAYIATIPGSNNFKIEKFIELLASENFDYDFRASILYRGLKLDPQDPSCLHLQVAVSRYNPTEPYAVVMVGDPVIVKRWEQYFEETFTKPDNKQLQTVVGVSSQGQLRITAKPLNEENAVVGHDAFYPFIEGGIEKLAKEFSEAKESVLVLIGPFGVGKTTLIRTLMKLTDYKNYGLCNSQQALQHPDIVPWMEQFSDGLVATEDSNDFVRAREKGNEQMSALLNLADGVDSKKGKIVISTNLPHVRDIDHALIRPGRTFKVIEFRKLTLTEANEAREAVGLKPIEDIHDPSVTLTLSEALNHERANNMLSKHTGSGSFLSLGRE